MERVTGALLGSSHAVFLHLGAHCKGVFSVQKPRELCGYLYPFLCVCYLSVKVNKLIHMNSQFVLEF